MTRRGLLAISALSAATDPMSLLLERAISHDDANFERMRHYMFHLSDELSIGGRRMNSQSFEVNLIGGGMYWRKLTQNGEPLSDALAEVERRRLQLHLSKGIEASLAESWRTERKILRAWLETHTFKHRGEVNHALRRAHVIESRPRKGAVEAGYFTHARCRLVLDLETGQWLDAELEFERDTKFAMFQLLLGRMSLPYSPGLINRGEFLKGSILRFGVGLMADGLWIPQAYLSMAKRMRSELAFSDFRRFSSESQLLTG